MAFEGALGRRTGGGRTTWFFRSNVEDPRAFATLPAWRPPAVARGARRADHRPRRPARAARADRARLAGPARGGGGAARPARPGVSAPSSAPPSPRRSATPRPGRRRWSARSRGWPPRAGRSSARSTRSTTARERSAARRASSPRSGSSTRGSTSAAGSPTRPCGSPDPVRTGAWTAWGREARPTSAACGIGAGAAERGGSLRPMSGPTTAPGPTAVGYAMHETTPSIHLIARPSIDLDGHAGYLRDVGGESWLERRDERRLRRTRARCSSSSRAGLLPQLGAGAEPERHARCARPARVLRQHPALSPRQRARARELLVRAAQRLARVSRTSSSAIAPARPSARRACATCASPTSAFACRRRSSRSASRS